MNPNSPLAPSPLSKDEPPSGLDCSGEFNAAPDIRTKRAGSRCGLSTASRAKRQDTQEPGPESSAGQAPAESVEKQGFDWQEWQGSNLRPPVLERGTIHPPGFVLIPRSPELLSFSRAHLPAYPNPSFFVPSSLVTLGCGMVAGYSPIVLRRPRLLMGVTTGRSHPSDRRSYLIALHRIRTGNRDAQRRRHPADVHAARSASRQLATQQLFPSPLVGEGGSM